MDKVAKEVSVPELTQSVPPPQDVNILISQNLNLKWTTQWKEICGNKLREVTEDARLKQVAASRRHREYSSRDLRTGHTRLTHRNLYEKK